MDTDILGLRNGDLIFTGAALTAGHIRLWVNGKFWGKFWEWEALG